MQSNKIPATLLKVFPCVIAQVGMPGLPVQVAGLGLVKAAG